MFYRENGQFKTSYRKDQQIFPITQDRWMILALIAFAFIGIPAIVDEYLYRAILIPFLILSLAALGVNILVGYCGQISLGSGAFMAVGAYMAYNTYIRIEGVPLILALLSGGFFATLVGIFFGIPSLRVKGLYLAVATLAAQFFCDWAFLRVGWFTNNTASGSVSVSNLNVFGLAIQTPVEKYLFCLVFLVVFALLAKNLVRSAIGREWMAIRDMDVAAADRYSPGVCQAQCLCRQLLHRGRGRWTLGLCAPRLLGARRFLDRPQLPVALHGHHWRHGLHHGQLLWCGLHRDFAPHHQPRFALVG